MIGEEAKKHTFSLTFALMIRKCPYLIMGFPITLTAISMGLMFVLGCDGINEAADNIFEGDMNNSQVYAGAAAISEYNANNPDNSPKDQAAWAAAGSYYRDVGQAEARKEAAKQGRSETNITINQANPQNLDSVYLKNKTVVLGYIVDYDEKNIYVLPSGVGKKCITINREDVDHLVNVPNKID